LLTESEIAALDDGAPITSSDAPPTATAPPGASTQQIEAGMREANLIEEHWRGRIGQYAEAGSLAQDHEKEERAKKVGEPLLIGTAHTIRS